MAKKPSGNNGRTKQRKQPECSQKLDLLLVFPFPCSNCDLPITEPKLFCSELCAEEATYVRYYRACKSDGRIKQPDVVEALRIRLALILGGGYSKKLRQLPDSVRKAVIERDGGKCRKCGQPGNEIDHIKGNSSDPENLQLLCAKCHNEKTKAGFISITAESHPAEFAKALLLDARVFSKIPERVCDRPDWNDLWRLIWRSRRELCKQKSKQANQLH